MRIKGIIMCNFRQYKYAAIPFPEEGIIGIAGLNGKGKSTIFNAIGWAFYGKIKDVLKEHIKNRDAGPREECYVILFFEYQGETYVLKRHLTKKDECFLKTASGRPLVVSGRSELTSYISDRFFNMDYVTFCACYYAQQEDFDALSKLTPAKRRETLTKLLRIDTIDKAVERVRGILSAHEEDIASKSVLLEQEADWQNKKTTSEQFIRQEQEALETAQKQVDAFTEQYKEALVKRAEGDTTYQTFTQLKQNYKQHLHELRTLQERVIKQDEEELAVLQLKQKRYQSIAHAIDEYNAYVEERESLHMHRSQFQEKMSIAQQLRAIKKDVDAFQTEYASLEEQTSGETSLQQEWNDILVAKETLKTTMEETEKLIQDKNLDIRSLKDKLQQLKETKEKFEQLGKESPCPTCERPLGEHFEETMSHIKEEQTPFVTQGRKIQEERDGLLVALKTDQETWQTLLAKEQTCTASLLEIDKKKDRLSFIQQQVQQLGNKYSDLMEQYAKVKEVTFDEDSYNRLVTLIKETKPLHDEALSIQTVLGKMPELESRISSSKEEVTGLQKTLDEIEQEVHALQFDESAYKALTAQIEHLQNAIHEEKERMTQRRYNIKIEESHIQTANETLAAIAQTREQVSEIRNEMAFYLKLNETYKAYKVEIIAQLTPDLSDIMSEDISVVTDGYYEQVELSRDFEISLYRLGEKLPLSFFSGGEQKLAALLQLLGVSHLLTSQTGQASFEMVAMDEVLGSFDDGRQASTIEQLRNLKHVFPQILMVAHQELVKDMFDYTLVVSTNEKRHSQAKWIKEWDDSEMMALMEPYLSVAVS